MTGTNPPVEEFSDDDRFRLAKSVWWQQDSELVESLCRLFYEIDPMRCLSSENPHAMTEYLLEVEMIARKLPNIASEKDLSGALQAVFEEMFAGDPSHCDWDDLARSAWKKLHMKSPS